MYFKKYLLIVAASLAILSLKNLGVISPHFHDCNCVTAFLLSQGFQLLPFVAHAEYVGVDAGVQFLCQMRGEEGITPLHNLCY